MSKSLLSKVLSEKTSVNDTGSFSRFLYGSHKLKIVNESESLTALVNELVVFIKGNKKLVEKTSDVKRTLFKHWKRGSYNSELAQKAWGRVVTEAAKIYAEKTIKESKLWGSLFPYVAINSITNQLETEFYTDLKKGKVDIEELFNSSEHKGKDK